MSPCSVPPPPAPRRGFAARFVSAALVLLALALPAASRPAAAAIASHVVIVSLDGLRPDVLLRADAPNLRALMARGAFTMWAITTRVAVTLPSHTSMLTGVPPAKHGVTWNDDRWVGQPKYPAVPTLFTLAHRAGLTTAMFAGKAKFAALLTPGDVDWSFAPPKGTQRDSSVAARAARVILEHAPNVLFVHLPDGDLTGHDHGWGSPEQLAVVANADRCVGRLLAAIARRGLADSTVIIVSADHGGSNHRHGGLDERSQAIPWIAAGPGIRQGLDLTSITDDDVHTEDTFATACTVLGLPLPADVDGRPVRAAFATAAGTR